MRTACREQAVAAGIDAGPSRTHAERSTTRGESRPGALLPSVGRHPAEKARADRPSVATVWRGKTDRHLNLSDEDVQDRSQVPRSATTSLTAKAWRSLTASDTKRSFWSGRPAGGRPQHLADRTDIHGDRRFLISAPRPHLTHRNLEREKGFEPSTSTLARWHSTTELLPRKEPGF